jgi:protein-tyrosine phosphatase
MIDIHSHILPGLDDGASNLQDSINMAKNAAGIGVSHIIATPHHKNGLYLNEKEDIINRVQMLNIILEKENIPVSILPGQEIRIYKDFLCDIEEFLTLNDTGKYLFLELPSNHFPSYALDLIYEIQLNEITPIIVHPERNSELHANPKLLFKLIDEGAVTQITTGSVLGVFGKRIKSFTESIIKHNLTHFVASDAHNLNKRNFNLDRAYIEIEKKFGSIYVNAFKANAISLINGQPILDSQPLPYRRKKLLGIF